jgi:hypothetical protein
VFALILAPCLRLSAARAALDLRNTAKTKAGTLLP